MVEEGNIFIIPFIFDQTSSMADKSEEFWVHLGIYLPFIFGP